MRFLEYPIFNNRVVDYFTAILIFLVCTLVIRIVIRNLLPRWKKRSETTTGKLDDFVLRILERIMVPFLYLGAVYLSLKSLSFPPFMETGLNYFQLGVIIFFGARFVTMLVEYGFSVYLFRRGEDVALERSLKGIMLVIRVLIWGGGLIFLLDNLGLKVSAVLAGLGVGGIAVALAAQTIFKDLFSYFSIIFDRPFKVGDFIIIDDYLGSIENIGIKTTRVRSLGGELLVFPNSNLTDSRLRNYGLMQKRRVVFGLGVEYQTPVEKLREIPALIKKIIESQKDTLFDRAHFSAYGDFALKYEIVFYVLSADYNKYMDIQQAVNLAIMEEFEARDIQFAYPTQTLYMHGRIKSLGPNGGHEHQGDEDRAPSHVGR